MKADAFLEAMGFLDDDLIEEALSPANTTALRSAADAHETGEPPLVAGMDEEPAQKKTRLFSLRAVRFIAVAAVFVLLLAGVRFALKRQPKTPEATGNGTSETATALPDAEQSAAATRAAAQSGETAVSPTEQPASVATEHAKPAVSQSAVTAAPRRTTPTRQEGPLPANDKSAATDGAPTRREPTSAPTTSAAETAPPTEAPSTQPATTTASFVDLLRDSLSSALGVQDLSSLLRLFGGGGSLSGNNAGEPDVSSTTLPQEPTVKPRVTVKPTQSPTESDVDASAFAPPSTAAPAGDPAAAEAKTFGDYTQRILVTEARLRQCAFAEKTQAELEALYGGAFLPTAFPGTAAALLPEPGAHGVYYESPDAAPTVFNVYTYQWNGSGGDRYSLRMYVFLNDGSYPETALFAEEAVAAENGVPVFLRSNTESGLPLYTALAKRGDTVLWFTLRGDCTQADFLRLVRSALQQ